MNEFIGFLRADRPEESDKFIQVQTISVFLRKVRLYPGPHSLW